MSNSISSCQVHLHCSCTFQNHMYRLRNQRTAGVSSYTGSYANMESTHTTAMLYRFIHNHFTFHQVNMYKPEKTCIAADHKLKKQFIQVNLYKTAPKNLYKTAHVLLCNPVQHILR
jgi:hypothetical protein